MAIDATDWTVDRATGDIRYTGDDHGGGGPTYATVIEFHRWLQGLADDASSTGDDELAIYDLDPSARSTDNIITLKNNYNIDATAAEHLYDGSIIQNDGDDIWDGIVNFGNSDVQIQIIQDGAILTDDWWNFGGGGLNASAAAGISHRFMIKTRSNGADIDGRRLRGTSRTFGNTYSEFPINGTSRGNNVLALSDATDLNNGTAGGTVATWDQFANDSEGFTQIDVNNDATDEDYYSSWDIGGGSIPASPTINDLYEYTKYITRDGTATTLYGGLSGEVFRGITHEIDYDGEAGAGFTELADVCWGTTFDYDSEQASGLTVGEYYTFGTSNAVGKLIALDDNGATGSVVFAIEPGSGTVTNGETFSRADGTATDGADVNSVPDNTSAVGGYGRILALDDQGTTGTMWIQILSGQAPVDDLELYARTTAGLYDPADHADCNGAPTSRSVSTPFIGASTGSAIIGSYGLGIDTSDLTQNDILTALDASTYSPPNIVTFTVGGLVASEDRVLVAPWDGVSTDPEGNPAIDVDQLELNTTLSSGTETAVVVTTAIPADTPTAGDIRIELDSGNYREVAYTSWTGSTFTIASTDFGSDNASSTNNVYIAYLDLEATGTSHSFQGVYSTDRDFVVIVRDGGVTPIKQFISSAQNSSNGGSITAIRTSDT